jgi:hypothetical protein
MEVTINLKSAYLFNMERANIISLTAILKWILTEELQLLLTLKLCWGRLARLFVLTLWICEPVIANALFLPIGSCPL